MTSAPAHNQVIVNGAPPPEKACGRLEAFSCGGKVKAVTTSANDAYKGVTEIYRRQTIFVDRAPGRRYLVDFFEVKGGKDHQLTFHADGETFKAPELDWTPQNTADLGNPETGYKWLKDCKSASSQGILSCQWISDPKSGLGTNLWMLPDGDTKLTLSVAHGLRDRKKPFDNVSLFPVIFRRPGPQNIFVSVIECFHGAPSIDRVEPLSVTAGKGWARAIKIHSGDTEDILITASEDAAGTTTECPALPQMKLKGRAAFISLKNNAPVYMWLMGDFIRWDKHELKGQPEIRGKITEVNSPENTVTVDSDIPESLKNEFLFIPEKFDGIYKIMAVSKTKDGKTLVKLPASEILSINQGDNFQIIPCSERQIEH
jgi:hypothetical protein